MSRLSSIIKSILDVMRQGPVVPAARATVGQPVHQAKLAEALVENVD